MVADIERHAFSKSLNPPLTTPYVCDSNLESLLERLEHNSELAIAWFEMNYMKLNTDKCHLLIS